MSCALRRNRRSSGKSPVRLSKTLTLNGLLFCPAPAKAMMASRCSCRSPVGPKALIEMWERSDSCLPAALFSHGAAGCFVSTSTPSCLTRLSSALEGCAPWPELRRIKAVLQCFRHSADPVAAPPTSSFMALLIDPLAVWAQALFPRCSSVCGCINFFVLPCCPVCSCPRILPMTS